LGELALGALIDTSFADAGHMAATTRRAESLMARLTPRGYWRVDDRDRSFFNPSDAGLPVACLLAFHAVVPAPMRKRILDVVRKLLAHELEVTAEVTNPFGYARQLVQNKAGQRRTAFFFPHDTEAAPWWQGENARLASLAYAARLGAPENSFAYCVPQLWENSRCYPTCRKILGHFHLNPCYPAILREKANYYLKITRNIRSRCRGGRNQWSSFMAHPPGPRLDSVL
jgi:hypothetical protein